MKKYHIVETYHNKEKDVFKFVHANGVENCLKIAPSCTNEGTIKENNKAVLFLSCSYGCTQRCKFCYLTNKKVGYAKLESMEIVNMAFEIIDVLKEEIKDKYFKISFMGMGDFFAEDLNFKLICHMIFIHLQDNVLGIDGVDIGTSFPNVDKGKIKEKLDEMQSINDYLFQSDLLKLNPRNLYSSSPYKGDYNTYRTIVRLFISLHSNNDVIRQGLMPKTAELEKINYILHDFKLDVILHCMFFENINDSPEQFVEFDAYLQDNYRMSEIRLLRFNKCYFTPYYLKESKNIPYIIDCWKNSNVYFKYQLSAGSEIQAACGQFIGKMR